MKTQFELHGLTQAMILHDIHKYWNKEGPKTTKNHLKPPATTHKTT